MFTLQARLLAVSVALVLPAVSLAEDAADLAAVHRIRHEAFQNSRVMDHAFHLTDVNGPRLTGSPGHKAAAEWAVQRLKEMGLSNARLEKWGPFGRGWSYSRFTAHMVAPQYSPLIGFPMAWSGATDGAVSGEAMLAVLRTEADLSKWKGKLKGKVVLMDAVREVPLGSEAMARRHGDEDLEKLAMAPEPGSSGGPPVSSRTSGPPQSLEEARKFRTRLYGFLKDEGVLVAVSTGYRGDGGTVFASSFGSREAKDPTPPAAVALTPEHYNRVVRLLERKLPVRLEFDVQARLHEETLDSWNVVAEIPGATRPDEVVMVGAHLDSWHGATGATDNAAGCSVAMEAVRVLMASGLKPDRTIRIALWSGEEQGLLGSKAYVKEHFADRETMAVTAQHGKLSGYYNLDNGTGKIRGIYLQGNDMLRPVFEAWLAPFRDLGATTASIRMAGGTDHLSFDAVGLPGFQFIQDPVEYSTRTHHSNMDSYDHLQKADLMQASAVMASFLWHTSQRPELLPRKPLPKPEPRKDAPATGTPLPSA